MALESFPATLNASDISLIFGDYASCGDVEVVVKVFLGHPNDDFFETAFSLALRTDKSFNPEVVKAFHRKKVSLPTDRQ